jgi:deazaflavin-dependent oxidoreductase (nitroreductase family)
MACLSRHGCYTSGARAAEEIIAMAIDVTKVPRDSVKPIPKKAIPFVKTVMHAMTRAHVWLFRATQGRLGKHFAGAPCCFVVMRGRKTGKPRTIPLIYIPDGDDVILIGSQGGMDIDPVWVRNLEADPHVEIIAAGKTRRMIARRADDAEKAKRWPKAVAVYADFDQYQARTTRDIPLFVCSPA